MGAERTTFEVPTWGRGTLWTERGFVIAHEFDFLDPADTSAERENAEASDQRAGPLEGALGPPTGTLPPPRERVGRGSVSTSKQRSSESDAARQSLDVARLIGRFSAFLGGSDVRFEDVPLDLAWCTPFQHAVAVTLRAIPRGEVVTYGELAALAGHPGAQRAAGTFCARNRFLLLLPCHRVVAADGIGAYGSAGVTVKRRLLALEGVGL